MCKGNVFNIQRFSTSDGPGIRTTVFLKGCPLNCAWCHNPESKSVFSELFYKKELCVGCQKCASVCPDGAHTFSYDGHIFNRESCRVCLKCSDVCPSQALEVCGKEATVESVIDAVLRDRPFYEQSGGGLTLSGGEPLMQYDFSLAVLKSAKEHNIHTAVETCGFTQKDLSPFLKYVDLWLYDIKLFPENLHIKYTGVTNKTIMDNLLEIDKTGAKIVLRCPIIPTVNLNEEHFKQIGTLANRLKNCVAIHLEPYHPLGLSKAAQLNKTQGFKTAKFLSADELSPFADSLKATVSCTVTIQ